MCGCKKETCNKCNHRREDSCGMKPSNDYCHDHSFKDIVFKKEVCNSSSFKSLGIYKGMSGEEIITILVGLISSANEEIKKLKQSIVNSGTFRRKTFYIINGGAKPEVSILGGLQNGDLLFENNTGDSSGVLPTIYEWNGVTWVLMSDLK